MWNNSFVIILRTKQCLKKESSAENEYSLNGNVKSNRTLFHGLSPDTLILIYI